MGEALDEFDDLLVDSLQYAKTCFQSEVTRPDRRISLGAQCKNRSGVHARLLGSNGLGGAVPLTWQEIPGPSVSSPRW